MVPPLVLPGVIIVIFTKKKTPYGGGVFKVL